MYFYPNTLWKNRKGFTNWSVELNRPIQYNQTVFYEETIDDITYIIVIYICIKYKIFTDQCEGTDSYKACMILWIKSITDHHFDTMPQVS